MPARLNETVYEPKRQRTFEVVKRAVDTLVKQRKLDGITRISLNTIVAMAKQQDPEGRGIAHTAILENEQAYAYYKQYRTAGIPAKRQPRTSSVNIGPVIKADRDQRRVKQRYMKLSREELADHLLWVQQEYTQLNARYLAMNDKLLEWQLRAEQAEGQLKGWQEQLRRQDQEGPSKPSSPKQRQRQRAERTTGPIPKHFVSLLAFARHHNIAETTVLTHIDMGLLPVKRGEWTDPDGQVVTLALDANGKAAFSQLYHGIPLFLSCEQCPHQQT